MSLGFRLQQSRHPKVPFVRLPFAIAGSYIVDSFELSDFRTDARMRMERLTRCLFVSAIQLPASQVGCLLFCTFPFLHSSSRRGSRSGFVHVLSASSSALATAGPCLA